MSEEEKDVQIFLVGKEGRLVRLGEQEEPPDPEIDQEISEPSVQDDLLEDVEAGGGVVGTPSCTVILAWWWTLLLRKMCLVRLMMRIAQEPTVWRWS